MHVRRSFNKTFMYVNLSNLLISCFFSRKLHLKSTFPPKINRGSLVWMSVTHLVSLLVYITLVSRATHSYPRPVEYSRVSILSPIWKKRSLNTQMKPFTCIAEFRVQIFRLNVGRNTVEIVLSHFWKNHWLFIYLLPINIHIHCLVTN